MDRKRMAKNRRRWLTAAVLLGLGMSAWAPLPAAAQTRETISSDGKAMFDVTYFDEGESWRPDLEVTKESTYTLSEALKTATHAGITYWSDILAPGAKNALPVQIFVRAQIADSKNSTQVYQNAAAETTSFVNGQAVGANDIAAAIQENIAVMRLDPNNPQQDISKGIAAVSTIEVGQHLGGNRTGSDYGWYIDTDTVLPTNEQAADYVGTIRHEMGHALGISSMRDYVAVPGLKDKAVGFSAEDTSANSWNLHLYDQTGSQARPGMAILTTAQFNAVKAQYPNVQKTDYFILDDKAVTGSTTGKAYFKGTHVSEVLDGAAGEWLGVWYPGALPSEHDRYDEPHHVFQLYEFHGGGARRHAGYGLYDRP